MPGKSKIKVDLAVVGAGSAGAAVAAQCAYRGMSVALLEAGSLERAGARWANLVPGWQFEAAGIPAPRGAELRARPAVQHLLAGRGPQRIHLRSDGFLDVEMGRLVARLQRAARGAGALLMPHTRVISYNGRELSTSAGDVAARWVVDASGMDGARLLDQPLLAPPDICQASQQVHGVADARAARAYLERYQVAEGEYLSFLGLHGGFSTLCVRLEGEHLPLLAGTVPADGHPVGQQVLDRFVEQHAWVGPRLSGGGRAIPIRRPYDHLARGSVAAVGDAACQVFPLHGSGTGYGLMAARMVADALDQGRGVMGYAADFMRRHGGTLAANDLFRGLQQGLTPQDLTTLMAARLIGDRLMVAAYSQRFAVPRPGELALLLLRSRKAPALTYRLARMASRMALVRAWYWAYPQDPRRIVRWSRGLRRLGLEPDPAPPARPDPGA